jgi:hypothetical protein
MTRSLHDSVDACAKTFDFGRRDDTAQNNGAVAPEFVGQIRQPVTHRF